jgi:hypothetical protein
MLELVSVNEAVDFICFRRLEIRWKEDEGSDCRDDVFEEVVVGIEEENFTDSVEYPPKEIPFSFCFEFRSIASLRVCNESCEFLSGRGLFNELFTVR